MLLCYLAVQRYNFFLENKIFPIFFSQKHLSQRILPQKTSLLNKHSLEIALKIRLIDAAALI